MVHISWARGASDLTVKDEYLVKLEFSTNIYS